MHITLGQMTGLIFQVIVLLLTEHAKHVTTSLSPFSLCLSLLLPLLLDHLKEKQIVIFRSLLNQSNNNNNNIQIQEDVFDLEACVFVHGVKGILRRY